MIQIMPSNTRAVTVAAVHASSVFMNNEATLDKIVGFVQQAGDEGIDLLVFPECFLPGYPYWGPCHVPLLLNDVSAQYIRASIEVPGPEIARIQAACARAQVTVTLGISERMSDTGTCFNSQVFIDADGRLLGVHRKLQPTHSERMIWAQGGGATLSVFETQAGNVGGLICYEHTMSLARQAMAEQAEEIHAAAWPGSATLAGFEEIHEVQVEALMKAHAICAQTFVVAASNPVDDTYLDWMESNLGPQDLLRAGGGWSAVIHPFGAFVSGPHTGLEEQLVSATIDLGDLEMVKSWIDAKGHYARREILRLQVDRRPLWADEEAVAPVQTLRGGPESQQHGAPHHGNTVDIAVEQQGATVSN